MSTEKTNHRDTEAQRGEKKRERNTVAEGREDREKGVRGKLPEGWEEKRLGEVCTVNAGQSPEGKYYNTHGKGTPFYQGKKEFGQKYIGRPTTWTTEVTKEAQAGDILMSVRAPVGPVNFSTERICIGRGLAAITAGRTIDSEFLFQFLIKHEPKITGNDGAVFPSINKAQIENITIPIPSLKEQKRIVAILDEAFATIDKARENAERNLANAREIFESYLEIVFANQEINWEKKKLGNSKILEIIDGDRGKNYPKKSDFFEDGYCLFMNTKNVRPDGFDFKTSMYITHKKDAELGNGKLARNDVVMTTRGTIGNLGIYSADIMYGNIRINSGMLIFRPNQKLLSSDYLFEVLRSSIIKKQIAKDVSGAAQPQLPIKTLVNFSIPVPDKLSDQLHIVSQIERLSVETKKLEAIYTKRIVALDELKKSILEKAFAGELTRYSTAVTFPVAIGGVTSTEVQAGLIAIAYTIHVEKGTTATFGHVKMEKISHLIEAHIGIDLDRHPVKDAAGPNDYRHLLKVESRARKAGYFDVDSEGERYTLKKLGRFDYIVAKTVERLGDRFAEIESLIKTMAKMDTQQAEIFATVYGAWNNILLDGREPTDEEIVSEAREKWHQAKLKIERKRFFSAISWMRDTGFVPSGKGKRVEAKKE